MADPKPKPIANPNPTPTPNLGEEARCQGRVRGSAREGALVVADAQLAQAHRSARLRRGSNQRDTGGLVLRHARAAPHAAAERGERVEVALRGGRGVPVRRLPRVRLAAANAWSGQGLALGVQV